MSLFLLDFCYYLECLPLSLLQRNSPCSCLLQYFLWFNFYIFTLTYLEFFLI